MSTASMQVKGRCTYQLQRQLGSGGFACVYRARTIHVPPGSEVRPPSEVAIKLFRDIDTEHVSTKEFARRELSGLRALNTDRVPRVYDWSLEEPPYFLAMEFFPLGSLGNNASFLGMLDDSQAWKLLEDLLTALAAAHRASIVHLDVKPGNVLLDGQSGYLLTDFGVAQTSMVSSSLSVPGVGSPGYLAPEQEAWDQRSEVTFDHRTDLWSLGATVWGAYCGINLARQQDLRTTLTDEEYGLPLISSLRPDCSPELEAIIMSLLKNHPGDRPGSALEVLSRMANVSEKNVITGDAIVTARKTTHDDLDVMMLLDEMLDPMWASILRRGAGRCNFARFENGEYLCRDGENATFAFVLISGEVQIEIPGEVTKIENRQGTFIGEIAALAGSPRTGAVRARGTVWTAVFNPAELERFLNLYPMLATRLLKSMAERLARDHGRRIITNEV